MDDKMSSGFPHIPSRSDTFATARKAKLKYTIDQVIKDSTGFEDFLRKLRSILYT